jgi:hypothetical protein
MFKEVRLGNDIDDTSRVHLSFCFSAVSGFGVGDELMLLVSDTEWENQVYLQTLPGALWGPQWQVLLPDTGQVREVDLTELWRSIHGCSLPNSFYVQVVNLDRDGVANVAHLDYIQISRGG